MLGRASLALVLVVSALQVGCSDDCGNASCGGGGAYVEWHADDLPGAGPVRLCVNGTCDRIQHPELLSGERELVSFNPEGDGVDLGDRVTVRLEVISDGRVLEGEGGKAGGCCPAYYFAVSDDGRSLLAQD